MARKCDEVGDPEGHPGAVKHHNNLQHSVNTYNKYLIDSAILIYLQNMLGV